jgi:heme exporter protein CcmD
MIDFGPHAGYILASYLVTIVIIAAIIGQSIVAYKSAKRQLDTIPESERGSRD